MSDDQRTAAAPGALENHLTRTSTVTLPEKAALSNTTTVCSPNDKSPRPSKDGSMRSNPFDTDVEAGLDANNSHEMLDTVGTRQSRLGLSQSKSDCQVWPGQAHWKQKAKLAKAKRSCTFMAGMSRRNRVITKIVIVLLVVGIAVGVGFGISIPLGAPIWGDKDRD